MMKANGILLRKQRRNPAGLRWSDPGAAGWTPGKHGSWWSGICAVVVACVVHSLCSPEARAALLMEESFDYPANSDLATNFPWAGMTGASCEVVEGGLTFSKLQSVIPSGNQLQIGGGTAATAYRNFSASPVVGGAIYCSFLLNCSELPQGSSLLATLMESGIVNPDPRGDPLDLYVQPLAGGYGLAVGAGGSGAVTAGNILSTNMTYLVVVKYTFGSSARAGLYIDPVPGEGEPMSPDVVVLAGGGGDDDDGEVEDDDDEDRRGVGASNLQTIAVQASAGSLQGVWQLDTMRVGTSWAEVTPFGAVLSVVGPQDQAVCLGSPVTFGVVANGTPPYSYAWRSNGIAIPDATNSSYSLPSPGPTHALIGYDVIVQDGYGSVTSRLAGVTFSTSPPIIVTPPEDQSVLPGDTQAVFSVITAGDAPITYQWRSNGIAVPGATNAIYTLTNPVSAEAGLLLDVVVANPCGAVTSSPPAALVFPNVFHAAYDAGPGFFGGENLFLTNSSGLSLKTWSSSSLTVAIPDWSLEGAMQEQPLNDGTSRSVYSINVTPLSSPTYYVFGGDVALPYATPIPVLRINTDNAGGYQLQPTNMVSTKAGVLTGNDTPLVARPTVTEGNLEITGTGNPGSVYVLESSPSLLPPVHWTAEQTNVADGTGTILFFETNTITSHGFYRIKAQ